MKSQSHMSEGFSHRDAEAQRKEAESKDLRVGSQSSEFFGPQQLCVSAQDIPLSSFFTRWLMPVILVFLTAPFLTASSPLPTPDLAPLQALIARQKDLHSVSADFIQSRSLRTLRSPLTSKGRLWFQSPDHFRWEQGDPPKTIVLGTPDGLTVIQPEKKQAVTKPLSPSAAFSAAGSFGLMHLPGNGNLEEFQKHVQVLALKTSGSTAHLEMLPRDGAAAQGLDSIRLDFNTVTGAWISLEIVTRDGSSIRSEFSNVAINTPLKKGLFDYDLNGFKVVHEKN